ncbi:hypothetical protein CQ043_25820 [Paenibacillus sp. MYb63]|nr:hypothetical protein CQ043_25820 [Paenibacillus sp. MYb63]PRA49860.1 hypothetical protein CQ061_05285 [Paenibacillus sp. MYb67]
MCPQIIGLLYKSVGYLFVGGAGFVSQNREGGALTEEASTFNKLSAFKALPTWRKPTLHKFQITMSTDYGTL